MSLRTRRTDRSVKPGEYADADVPMFQRLGTDPDLVLHTFALRGTSYDRSRRFGTSVCRALGELALDDTSLGS